jgi:hypothetical protein
MRVFVIDASNMGPELQGGLIGVVGPVFPAAEVARADEFSGGTGVWVWRFPAHRSSASGG